MEYLKEVTSIVNRYSKIKSDLANLEVQAHALTLQKNRLEFELSMAREEEIALIDRIKQETGSEPDFYKILQELSDGRSGELQ